jgi:hypothetical protein
MGTASVVCPQSNRLHGDENCDEIEEEQQQEIGS